MVTMAKLPKANGSESQPVAGETLSLTLSRVERASGTRPWALARQVKSYLLLLKLKKVAMLTFVAVASALAAAPGAPPVGPIAWLLLAGILAAGGACTLNHYLDRDLDALMSRTQRRPLASGQITASAVAPVGGVVLIALSLAVAWIRLNPLATLFIFLGAFTYVVLYTAWLKRRSSFNIVIGGLAGSCAALAGWSAVNEQLTPVAVLLGLLIFLWTPSHFWSLALVYQEDYRRAGVPMLPVLIGPRRTARAVFLNSGVLVLASLSLVFLEPFGVLYLILAVLAGVGFLALGGKLLLSPTRAVAWLNYKLSGAYLGTLFLAMLADLYIKL